MPQQVPGHSRPHAGNGGDEILLLLEGSGRLVAVRLGTGIWVLKKSGFFLGRDLGLKLLSRLHCPYHDWKYATIVFIGR